MRSTSTEPWHGRSVNFPQGRRPTTAFENILGRRACPLSMPNSLADQMMANHWHSCSTDQSGGSEAFSLRWVTLTHTRAVSCHYTLRRGTVYRGRFKSSYPDDAISTFLCGTSNAVHRRAEWCVCGELAMGVSVTWVQRANVCRLLSQWPLTAFGQLDSLASTRAGRRQANSMRFRLVVAWQSVRVSRIGWSRIGRRLDSNRRYRAEGRAEKSHFNRQRNRGRTPGLS